MELLDPVPRILVEKNKDQKSSKKEDPLQLWRVQTFIEANTILMHCCTDI